MIFLWASFLALSLFSARVEDHSHFSSLFYEARFLLIHIQPTATGAFLLPAALH
jgi:hypothetical protein